MSIVRVRGRSMIPTLRPGDILWVAKPRRYKRGDIVLVKKNGLLVKRIVGLPGESIAVKSSQVYVNGRNVVEPYVSGTAFLEPLPDQSIQLEASSYFLMGDARDDSLDSRRFGPVKTREIKGTARQRVWPPKRWGRLMLALGTLAAAANMSLAAAAPGRLLAFASETRLALMIGKYDHKWIKSTQFYAPPIPGSVFTLYGPSGRIGEVTITDEQRAYPGGVFTGWSAKVSPWDFHAVPYALAVSGSPDLGTATLEPIPPDNPEYRGIVSKYLKGKGLAVQAPDLTQAYMLPIEGHGRDAALLVAHNDASAVQTDKSADIYAVALLWWNDHGQEKIFPFESETSHKPAGRSLEEHQKYYGVRDFLRVLCAVDIDGDGWKEIVLYRAREDSTNLEIFHFDGRRLKKVLAAEKIAYN